MSAPLQPNSRRPTKRPRPDSTDFSSLANTANIPKSLIATTSGPSYGVAPTTAPDRNTLAALDTDVNWFSEFMDINMFPPQASDLDEDGDVSDPLFTYTNSSRDSSAFLNCPIATASHEDPYANPPPHMGDTEPVGSHGRGGTWDIVEYPTIHRGDSSGASSSRSDP